MAGEGERTPPQSPRSKALLQHFERKVRLHAEHLDEDVRVTNERLGQLETAQIETNTKLASLEGTLGSVNTSLVGVLERLKRMEQNRCDGFERRNHNNNNTMGSAAGHDEEEYAADTELDEEVNGHRRIEQHRRRHETGLAHHGKRYVPMTHLARLNSPYLLLMGGIILICTLVGN